MYKFFIQLVGFVLYNFTYSTWEGKQVYMEDLYVQPQHRSKGIGTKVGRPTVSPVTSSLDCLKQLVFQLWKGLVKHALDIGCSRCHFNVSLKVVPYPYLIKMNGT